MGDAASNQGLLAGHAIILLGEGMTAAFWPVGTQLGSQYLRPPAERESEHRAGPAVAAPLPSFRLDGTCIISQLPPPGRCRSQGRLALSLIPTALYSRSAPSLAHHCSPGWGWVAQSRRVALDIIMTGLCLVGGHCPLTRVCCQHRATTLARNLRCSSAWRPNQATSGGHDTTQARPVAARTPTQLTGLRDVRTAHGCRTPPSKMNVAGNPVMQQ